MLLLAAVDGISVCHLYLLQVEEDLERARVAITDSDLASFLPSKRNGSICSVSYPSFCFRLFFCMNYNRQDLNVLSSEHSGKFLMKFIGPVNVRVARKEDRLKIKDEYNNYRVCLSN
jgi:hypothetical protein